MNSFVDRLIITLELAGYEEKPVGQWLAGMGVEVKAPLIRFERGLITPPLYLLDCWGGLGFNFLQVDGSHKWWPAITAKLQLRTVPSLLKNERKKTTKTII